MFDFTFRIPGFYSVILVIEILERWKYPWPALIRLESSMYISAFNLLNQKYSYAMVCHTQIGKGMVLFHPY